ncbi:MAG TPA: TolC family protein, partial [Vicinamibacterales bacterium]|nr:TolC family protein [Vicinamibacterales bacterium]
MRRIAFALAVVLAAALTAAAPAAAPASSQPAPLRLTLDEATTRALEQSHRLAEARARQAAATATIEVRRKSDDPTLTASAGYTRTNHVDEFGIPQPNGSSRLIYPDLPNNYRSRLELAWPIYTGGRTNALERAAQAEASATGKDLDMARLDLRLEVARAYWALATARDTVGVLEQSLATADQSLADVRARVEAGFLPPNDVPRSEAQRARSELMLVEARGRVESVTIDLARLIGLDDVPPIEPADALEGPAAISTDASALVTEAMGQRPELAAISERSTGITARLDAIAATRKPTVSFLSGYDFANPNPRIFPRQDKWQDSYDLTLNVSWQFWDSGRAQADRVEALANQNALTERQREVETQIRADVRKALVDVTISRAALAPVHLAITAAQETRRVVNDRFEAGVATTLDVLDAQLAEM